MYKIMVLICSAGALLCNPEHNAESWFEPDHDIFDNPQSCQAKADALMKKHPPPADRVGKLACINVGEE